MVRVINDKSRLAIHMVIANATETIRKRLRNIDLWIQRLGGVSFKEEYLV